jgi:hypothetical protein
MQKTQMCVMMKKQRRACAAQAPPGIRCAGAAVRARALVGTS